MLFLVLVTRDFFLFALFATFRAFTAFLCVARLWLFSFLYFFRLNWIVNFARLLLFKPLLIGIFGYGLLFWSRFNLTRLLLPFLKLKLLIELLLTLDSFHSLSSHCFLLFSGWRLLNFNLAMSDVLQCHAFHFLIESISCWNMLLPVSDGHRLRHLAPLSLAKDLSFMPITVVILLCLFFRGASQARRYALDLSTKRKGVIKKPKTRLNYSQCRRIGST